MQPPFAGFNQSGTFQNRLLEALSFDSNVLFDIENFPSLKGIFRAGIGKDNVPEQTAKKRNILVRYPSKSTINIIFNETASFTCSLIFRMLYHGLGTIEPWHKENRRSLSSKKLLVVGNGNIGKRVAQRMSLFMPTKTFDIRDNDAFRKVF